jgi:hypothetical protein
MFTQALEERFERHEAWCAGPSSPARSQNADERDAPRLLCFDGERRVEEGERYTGDERPPIDHSIT